MENWMIFVLWILGIFLVIGFPIYRVIEWLLEKINIETIDVVIKKKAPK